MIDVKKAVHQALENILPQTANIEKVRSFKTTEQALRDCEKIVFNSSALALGDLRSEKEVFSIGFDKNKYTLTILLFQKNRVAAEQSAINVRIIKEALRNNPLQSSTIVFTQLVNVSNEIRLTDRISYHEITFSVTQVEPVSPGISYQLEEYLRTVENLTPGNVLTATGPESFEFKPIPPQAIVEVQPHTHPVSEVVNLSVILANLSTELSAKADISHNHDSLYAPLVHTHAYEPVFAKNTAFNKNFGTSAGTVAEGNHNHNGIYSLLSHSHDGIYAPLSHTHPYEPSFAKNTAFNKNFGTTAGTVSEGNHNHDSLYETKNSNIQAHIASPHLQLGETSSTAYRGDRGKTAYDHAVSPHAPSNATQNSTDTFLLSRTNHLGMQDASTITQSASYRFVTDSEKTAWNSKADGSHTHPEFTSLQTQLNGKSDSGHNHHSLYYTKSEVNDLLANLNTTPAEHTHDDIYLNKTNTTQYTPTENYHPATKKYVDDNASQGGGSGDMTKTVYDANNNGKVDVAESAESVHWGNVQAKPSLFPPSVHQHTKSDISDFAHIHTIADVTNLQSSLDSKAAVVHSHDWGEITSKPASFTPSAHNHLLSEITGLDTALSGKANSSHQHPIADVTGLQAALDSKSATSHSHSEFSTLQTQIDNKAALVHNHDDRYYTESEVDSLLGNIASALDTINGQVI